MPLQPGTSSTAKPAGHAAEAEFPESLLSIVSEARAKARQEGKDDEEINRIVNKSMQLAGWYRVHGGWKQLGPDVRDKVQLHEAIAQPDGTYVIPDVQIFYPNAVKGEKYDAGAIQQVIDNTNKSITEGGRRPALVEGHISKPIIGEGEQAKVRGEGINFRMDPKRPGWMTCDLVNVKPETVEAIRKGDMAGLSAGMAPPTLRYLAGGSVNDAAGLNKRVGHIAMLGGAAPALSRLPALEIYSVDNQLCFSAESPMAGPPPLNTEKGSTPMLTEQHRQAAQGLAATHAALHAAYTSLACGEEGADKKLDEAKQQHEAARSKYEAAAGCNDLVCDPAHKDKPHDDGLVQKLIDGDKNKIQQDNHEAHDVPSKNSDGLGKNLESNPDRVTVSHVYKNRESQEDNSAFAVQTNARFSALSAELKQTQAQLKSILDQQSDAAVASRKSDFASFLASLRQGNHVFDENVANTQFAAVSDNDKAIQALKAVLASTPVRDSLADMGQMFSAEDAHESAKKASSSAQVTKIQQSLSSTPGNEMIDPKTLAFAATLGAMS